MSWRDGANFSGSLLVATGAISERTNKIVLKDLIPEHDSFSVTTKKIKNPCGRTRFLLCDWSSGQRDCLHIKRFLWWLQGVLVEGLLQTRNGNRKSWNTHTRRLSTSPAECLTNKLAWRLFYFENQLQFTIKDVGSIQSLLLLLEHVHVESSSVAHLIITVHHTPVQTELC